MKRAEEGDTPGWRVRLRDAAEHVDQAIKLKQHSRVGPLMRDLRRLIDEGARADEVTASLVRNVDRRAGRAHKINELEVKRESIVTPTELAVVFGGFIELLRTELDDKAFRALLPKVQALAGAPRPGIVGSAAEREVAAKARGVVEGVGGESSPDER